LFDFGVFVCIENLPGFANPVDPRLGVLGIIKRKSPTVVVKRLSTVAAKNATIASPKTNLRTLGSRLGTARKTARSSRIHKYVFLTLLDAILPILKATPDL
jgi:hypothetical protein